MCRKHKAVSACRAPIGSRDGRLIWINDRGLANAACRQLEKPICELIMMRLEGIAS